MNKIDQKKKLIKSRNIQIDHDLGRKQCNGIIKGWLHCLTSESEGRFIVNNILLA